MVNKDFHISTERAIDDVPVASGKELLTMTAAGGTKFIIGSPFTKTLSQPASKYFSSSCCERRLVKLSVLSRSASNQLLNGDLSTHVAPTPDARWNVATIRFALASWDHQDMVAVPVVVVVVALSLPRDLLRRTSPKQSYRNLRLITQWIFKIFNR